MTPFGMFLFAAGGALAGMIAGGLFGLAAAVIAPALVSDAGTSIVIGAAGGAVLGGELAAVVLILATVLEWRRAKS